MKPKVIMEILLTALLLMAVLPIGVSVGLVRFDNLSGLSDGLVEQSGALANVPVLAEDIHDVAVINVTPSETWVKKGSSLSINVTVENQGDYPETFNVTALSGNATFTPGQWWMFWNIGDVNFNGYIDDDDHALIMLAFGSCVGDPNYDPYCDLDSSGCVNPTDINSFFWFGYGWDIWSYFGLQKLSFETQTGVELPPGNQTTLIFTWSTTGVPYGNYTISANATTVSGETGESTIDNFRVGDVVDVIEIVEIPIEGGEKAIVRGNVTITNASVTENALHLNASGPSGSTGWINVTFPMVNTTEIEVLVDGEKITPPPFPVINTNGTHYFIYFEFTLSTRTITIQFGPTVSVGGISILVNKLSLLAPYIGLTILLAVAVVTVAYSKKRNRD